ncbi:hypothetical protein [Natrinema gari]|uniref:Uncharacterized protein n=1 Tax=Natrinema gari JCM 14663 TaxID=1230459 RepID=L9YR26_9EURY|nr:hypothetical protein [Natrinema gari]ELY75373.1 hypothetical protein C486_19263 [Natrinema gari JCM 14663]
MSENSDERETTDTDEHGRDVQLTQERTDPEAAQDEEGLTEEEMEARERQAEAERKRDIDEDSVDREDDALENANPDHHRDEEPYNS